MKLCSKAKDAKEAPAFGVRHVQVLYMFILLAVGVGMRVHLSVAIVAMTDTKSNNGVPTYDWNNKSIILSSFYWGYIWLQVGGAELGRKYGTKQLLLGAMFINSLVMILTPLVAAHLGSYGVMGCRTVMGLAQGFFYCSTQNLLSKWAPLDEKTRLTTIALAGASFGTIITLPVVGFLCSTSLGWPFSFYIYGGLGLIWIFFYFFYGSNSPQDHKSITEAERTYIESTKDVEGNKFKAPWQSIFTSLPVLAVFCTQVGSVWGYTILLSEMPIYMNKVMGFDVQSNGLLSAAPYLTNFMLSFVFGYMSDYIINSKLLSITGCRKIACTLGCVIPAVALIVLGYLPQDATAWSVLMLVLAVGFQAAASSSYMVNHIDLSPNFSGILMAICNSSSYFFSLFGPIAVQYVVLDESDKTQWRIIFMIAASVYLIPNVFYLIFGTAKVQPWNTPEGVESKVNERVKKMSVISIMST